MLRGELVLPLLYVGMSRWCIIRAFLARPPRFLHRSHGHLECPVFTRNQGTAVAWDQTIFREKQKTRVAVDESDERSANNISGRRGFVPVSQNMHYEVQRLHHRKQPRPSCWEDVRSRLGVPHCQLGVTPRHWSLKQLVNFPSACPQSLCCP